jgi:hypothetical protein
MSEEVLQATSGAQEEDLGIGEEMRFELVRSKTVSGIAGLGAAMEKRSGPHAASVARNVERQVPSMHRLTTKLKA